VLGWTDGRLRCLPSFLIVGAQKAATGSLASWLGEHPHLRRGVGPAAHVNEVHYFDQLDGNATRPLANWRSYLRAFPAVTPAEAAFFARVFFFFSRRPSGRPP